MVNAGGFGIEENADKVGMVALGVTAAGLAAHAIATNLRKHKLVDELIAEGKQSEHELKKD
jgi:hydrogenase small subunit